MTLPELAAAITIAALGLGVSVPALGTALRSWKLDGAARGLALEMQRTRMEAVARGVYAGILFQRDASGGRWRLYQDGGGRGIRSAEIASGIDSPLGPTAELAASYPGIRLGIDAPPPIPRIPPSTGTLMPGGDPIAFSGSDIFSASPTGETSGGTLYLTDGRDMRAVVAFGPTGRIRIWKYDGEARRWAQ